MKEDEILYIHHGEDEPDSTDPVYKGRNSADQSEEVLINSREDGETEDGQAEGANATEAAANPAIEQPIEQQIEQPIEQPVEQSIEQSTETQVEPQSIEQQQPVQNTTSAPSIIEPVSIETSESEETPEAAPEKPLDRIDQIANSAGNLPLPSEETEEIDPLLPY